MPDVAPSDELKKADENIEWPGLFDEMFEDHRTATLRVTDEGIIKQINPSAEELLGDVVGQFMGDVFEVDYDPDNCPAKKTGELNLTHPDTGREIKLICESSIFPSAGWIVYLVPLGEKDPGKEERIKSPKLQQSARDHDTVPDSGLTSREKQKVKEKKQSFVEAAQAAALRALVQSYKDADYNTTVDTKALIHACVELSNCYPRAWKIVERINQIEEENIPSSETILESRVWNRRN